MGRALTVLVCAGILLAAAGGTYAIFATEPEARRAPSTVETAMLADVAEARRGTHRPIVVATGTVRASRDVVLSPRVAGEVVERSPAFTPGGVVRAGDVLLRVDPADFENALAQRESELRRARADLELEMGRQSVARRDFELLDGELSPENEALVLRGPQLETAKAAVEAARAALRQAEIELERTTVVAPFDAHVLTREVDVGSQVSPGDRLGRLVGLETYWVVTTVPLAKLRWIRIPDAPGERGARAEIRSSSAWGDAAREGWVERRIGALEEATRLARLLVTVPDPLARLPGSEGAPPLTIGAYVEVRIEGEEIPDVVRLERDLVRRGDTVWVMDDGALRIAPVQILFRDARYAYVADGLEDGDLVVVTDLSTVVEGAPLRLRAEERGTGRAVEAEE